ncbi:unnamed protein product [Ambrosiozyma monospora]|uniref:EKC/KEOPS complex subunit CGI121 n=1 Tax=Ambrosiozyma monospora TaxID=43982 RepID=A0A9W6Z045_AMBMO|nr:unnamed protein product [Ambrosiozyma monospora]
MTTNYRLLDINQFPSYKVFATVFTDVKNTDEIKSHLIKGDRQYDFAFINAENILSFEQLYSALYKALLDDTNDRKKSKTLHTELIFDLAPQKNIMECLNKFGISSHSSNLLVIKIIKSQQNYITDPQEEEKVPVWEDVFDQLNQNIDGEVVSLNDETFKNFANLNTIKKNFKLGNTFTENTDKLNRQLISVTQLKGI